MVPPVCCEHTSPVASQRAQCRRRVDSTDNTHRGKVGDGGRRAELVQPQRPHYRVEVVPEETAHAILRAVRALQGHRVSADGVPRHWQVQVFARHRCLHGTGVCRTGVLVPHAHFEIVPSGCLFIFWHFFSIFDRDKFLSACMVSVGPGALLSDRKPQKKPKILRSDNCPISVFSKNNDQETSDFKIIQKNRPKTWNGDPYELWSDSCGAQRLRG